MIEVKQVFADKLFKSCPSMIKKHKVFKEFKTINKIFPDIGLSNCEKEIEFDNSKDALKSAKRLVNAIYGEIDDRAWRIKYFSRTKNTKVKQREKDVSFILKQVKKNLNRANAAKAIKVVNGKHTLNLHTNIIDANKQVLFKSGEGLFKVYNKLNELLTTNRFCAMKKLDKIQEFKEFSAQNVPSLKYKVVFSSSGSEGLWDIITMSMRGIDSCQTWGRDQSSSLVGSMIDPFTGIIYLTSGSKFDKYGTKMIRRSVVRFVLGKKNEKPSILIERMYPSFDKEILKRFTDLIKEKTDNKITVIYSPHSAMKYFVPASKALTTLDYDDQPYADSGIEYRGANRDEEDLEDEKSSIEYECTNAIISSIRDLKSSLIDKASKKAMDALHSSKEYYGLNWVCKCSIRDTISAILNKIEDIPALKAMLSNLLSDVEKFILSLLEAKSFSKLGISQETKRNIAKAAASKVKKVLNKELELIEKQYPSIDTTNSPYAKFLN